jgi:hypothetical protein
VNRRESERQAMISATLNAVLLQKNTFSRSIRTKVFSPCVWENPIYFEKFTVNFSSFADNFFVFIVLRPQKYDRKCAIVGAHKMQRIRRIHAHKKTFCSTKKKTEEKNLI